MKFSGGSYIVFILKHGDPELKRTAFTRVLLKLCLVWIPARGYLGFTQYVGFAPPAGGGHSVPCWTLAAPQVPMSAVSVQPSAHGCCAAGCPALPGTARCTGTAGSRCEAP